MPEQYVLDSFALVALLRAEPGAQRVQQLVQRAQQGEVSLSMSTVNAGEVAYLVERRGGLTAVHQLLALLQQAPITMVDATWERVLAAAHIKASHAISYADAFTAALALEQQATILTGDPEFGSVSGEIAVEWLARR